jgi:hypothetical protein
VGVGVGAGLKDGGEHTEQSGVNGPRQVGCVPAECGTPGFKKDADAGLDA